MNKKIISSATLFILFLAFSTFAGRASAYTISGKIAAPSGIGMLNVQVSLSTGQETTTDSLGHYRFDGLSSGSYTITPVMSGYTFKPTSKTATITSGNIKKNFVGKPVKITGKVLKASGAGMPNVTVTLTLGGDNLAGAVTDINGSYKFSAVADGNYTVTPQRAGFTFTPASANVTINGGNASVASFTGAKNPPSGSSALQGNWYVNFGASNTPWWARGPISIDSNGNVSGTATDWQGNTKQIDAILTMNNGVITSNDSSTFQGAMDSGGTVVAATETDGNQTKLLVMTKNQGVSYSASDMDGKWELYNFESDEDSSGQSEGPWWVRGAMKISNGSWSINGSQWDGTTLTATGTVTINPDNGIMSITIAGLSNNKFRCSMDSGKTVAACTWNSGDNGGSGTGIGLLVKEPSTNISISDLAGTWQMQQIIFQGPAWQRGSLTFDSGGNITSFSITTSDGETGTCSGATCPTGGPTIIGADTWANPSTWGLTNVRCSVDASETVVVCNGGSPNDNPPDAELIVMLKQ